MRFPTNFIAISQGFHVGLCLDFGWSALHGGSRVPIYACDEGKVYSVEWQPKGGNVIYIQHDDGKCSCYAHLSKVLVKKGQRVSLGEQIGNMGATGVVSGPHLHFGLFTSVNVRYKDSTLNPFDYLEVYKDQTVGDGTNKIYGNVIKKHGEIDPKDWTAGDYKIKVAKTIRTTMHLVSANRVRVKECLPATKKVLTSTRPNDIAMIKVGAIITITNVYSDNVGRLWGKYGNCYIVIRNVDGTPQAEKV